MPATATRGSSFTPRLVGATEQYIKDTVQDVVFNQNIYFWLLKQLGRVRVGKWGHKRVVSMRQNRGAAAETGRHLDPVTFSVPDGPQAAAFDYGEYRKGIAYSKSEMADNSGNSQQVDLIQERIDAEVLTFAEGINYDLIHGNVSDSLKVTGLMQALYPKDHITVDADRASRVQMRQANNSYGDITRVASAGTGWENCSLNLDLSENTGWSGTDNRFGLNGTNNASSGALRALDRLMLYGCTYGKIKPKLILSTPTPWLDYQNATRQTIRFAGKVSEADLGIPYIMHQGCMWGVEEQLAAIGTYGNADTAGADVVAVINTDYAYLDVEEGWFFDPSRDWSEFPTQVADGTILLFRAFHYMTNPRYSGILFNYGVA